MLACVDPMVRAVHRGSAYCVSCLYPLSFNVLVVAVVYGELSVGFDRAGDNEVSVSEDAVGLSDAERFIGHEGHGQPVALHGPIRGIWRTVNGVVGGGPRRVHPCVGGLGQGGHVGEVCLVDTQSYQWDHQAGAQASFPCIEAPAGFLVLFVMSDYHVLPHVGAGYREVSFCERCAEPRRLFLPGLGRGLGPLLGGGRGLRGVVHEIVGSI